MPVSPHPGGNHGKVHNTCFVFVLLLYFILHYFVKLFYNREIEGSRKESQRFVSTTLVHFIIKSKFEIRTGNIFNNFSLKSRWIAASLSDLKNTFCGLLCVFWYSIILNFHYFRFTNGGETGVYTGHFVLFGSRIIHSVGGE